MTDSSRPSASLLQQQTEWLAPARGRLLRRVGIARCRHVLDLGCGTGAVTAELARRAAGFVVALDRGREALLSIPNPSPDREGADGSPDRSLTVAARMCHGTDRSATVAARLCRARFCQADAARLPFVSGSFDLVFCQFSLMWMDAPAVISEIRRVLVSGGRLAAIEPDYGGIIEYPPEVAVRELWLAGLSRGGADPSIGRKLPGLLATAGFAVQIDLLDRLVEPAAERFDLLAGLPLEPEERDASAAAKSADARLAAAGVPRVAHLPVFLIAATKKTVDHRPAGAAGTAGMGRGGNDGS